MKMSQKIFLSSLLIILVISGVWFAQNNLGNSISSQATSSSVKIENGVSGVVTINDPTLNQSIDVNVEFFPLNTGSGVIVSDNGYIITAFHVISDPQTLENQERLKKMDENDIKHYVEQGAVLYYLKYYNPKLGAELSNTQLGGNLTLLTELFIEKNLLNAKSSEQVIRVNFPSSIYINEDNSLNAQLIDVGDEIKGTDVALLKVNTPKNLPTVNVSRANPVIGEKIWIYGYPYDNHTDINHSHPYTPSTTSGYLIFPTPNSRGTIYYQTSALTAHGYSGGPVFDNQNRLKGIVIFGVKFNKLLKNFLSGEYTSFLSSDYILKICIKNNVPIKVV